jgi:type IV pilus assembly protein PilM
MSAVGLDIGTYTIKAVHAKAGKKPQIVRTVELLNTTGVSVPTDEAAMVKLSSLLDAMFTDHKLARTDVRLALPEQVVSTKVISIPPLTDAELASAIGWQAEQHIPIPYEELALQYQVLFRPEKNAKDQMMRVLLVGARKAIVDRYTELFLNIGIEPTWLETQVISSMRSMQFGIDEPTTMVVTIGGSTMNLAVVWRGELSFVFSHLNGGQLLTKTIEQTIGLDPQQAEQYKRTYGLEPNQFEGKIRAALEPTIKLFASEIMKAMQFFSTQYHGEAVQRLLLAGGTAQLPGLAEYMAGQIGVEVLVADPFAVATGDIPQANHPSFPVAMGLLMKEE